MFKITILFDLGFYCDPANIYMLMSCTMHNNL